jgi:hypothetical protein
MITVLIYALLLLLVFGVLVYAVDLVGLPPNLNRLAKLILALILVLLLLNLFIGLPPGPLWRLER